jgi:hypothetical protein
MGAAAQSASGCFLPLKYAADHAMSTVEKHETSGRQQTHAHHRFGVVAAPMRL